MKKIVITIVLLCMVATLTADKKSIGSGELPSPSSTVDHAWGLAKSIQTNNSDFYILIRNETADSSLAYRIKGRLYPKSGITHTIVDSAAITGPGTDLVEYIANGFSEIEVYLYNVSDSVGYQVESIVKD